MSNAKTATIFLGIDHPSVAAEDVDALAEWYCDTLGYAKQFRNDKPVWLLRAPDGTLLEIMPRDQTPRPPRTTWTPGWSHLAIRVHDFEIAERFLEERGVAWTGETAAAVGGGKVRSFCDPEGNLVQIVARSTDESCPPA
jgi:glyoxylase I family protein